MSQNLEFLPFSPLMAFLVFLAFLVMGKEYYLGLGWGAIVWVYHVEIHWSGSFTPHSMIRSCINKQLLSRYIIARRDIRASECMRQKGTYNQ